MRFRQLTRKDVPGIVSLLNSLSEEDRKNFSPHSFTQEYINTLFSHHRIDLYFGLFQKEELVGYSMLRGYSEGYRDPIFGGAIHNNYRGKGLGKKLLLKTIQYWKKYKSSDKMLLKVKKENIAAIELYKKVGFILSEKKEYPEFYWGELKF